MPPRRRRESVLTCLEVPQQERPVSMKRELIALVGGLTLAGGVLSSALADEPSDPFATLNALDAAQLQDARGGMAPPGLAEIVAAGLEPLESVVPELGKLVVLAATGARSQQGRIILDADLSALLEPLVTGFGDGIRGRVPPSVPQIDPPSLQLDVGPAVVVDNLGRVKVQF